MHFIFKYMLKGAALAIGFSTTIVLAVTLTTFQRGQIVSSSALNANFAALAAGLTTLEATVSGLNQVPAGTIVAWHKNFYAPPPALPDGWVECNGQMINDADSPFNTQSVPDLNGQGRFLRGAAVSGVNQGHAVENHEHFRNPLNLPEHDMRLALMGGPSSMPTGSFFPANLSLTGSMASGSIAAETRPINMSVVWIIKIK